MSKYTCVCIFILKKVCCYDFVLYGPFQRLKNMKNILIYGMPTLFIEGLKITYNL